MKEKRAPRFTVRVLASLPLESFRDEDQRKQVKAFLADPSHELDQYQLDQPLLNEARRLFATRVPDRHKEATKAAKQPVYEVRDRQGAAWRGAAILDDEGDPWVVYVGRHDQFHAKVARALSEKKPQNLGKSSLEEKKPTKLDFKLRKREELRIRDRQWRKEIIASFISGVVKALKMGNGQEVQFPAHSFEKNNSKVFSDTHVYISIDSDVVSAENQSVIEVIENSESLISLGVRFTGNHDKEGERIAQEILCFMNSYFKESADYDRTLAGDLSVDMIFPQSVLAQLLATETEDESSARPISVNDDKTHLHYVCKEKLTESYVDGTAVRAVCGVWFVATLSDSAKLPVCCDCEQQLSTAQFVYDLIHGRFS